MLIDSQLKALQASLHKAIILHDWDTVRELRETIKDRKEIIHYAKAIKNSQPNN